MKNLKFIIIGFNNRNIFFALEKLLKAFDRNFSISNDGDGYLVFIHVIIYNDKIKVILKTDNINIVKETIIIDDIYRDLKYLILTCFYQLLTKLTKKELSYGVLTGIRPTKLVYKYKNNFSDEEVIKILKDKYLVNNKKAELLLNIANHQLSIVDFAKNKQEVSIYINIPFCLSRCTYCSFTSYPCESEDKEKYLQALLHEIEVMGEFLKENNLSLTTIYVGGGTPSVLNHQELALLLKGIEKYLYFAKIKEFTFECGRVDSLDIEKLRIIKNSQVTRISINPQTFNEKTLFTVNRKHTIKEFYEIYYLARKLGFNNINMDLIIGLPNEDLNDIISSIDKVLELKPEAITVHYLAQKKGSTLYHEKIRRYEAFYHAAFDYAFNNLTNNNYLPYYLYRQKNIVGNLENIGYAKPGFESIYNILMIEEKQTIIGLGCGASSKYLNYDIILNPRDLKSYIESYEGYLNKKIIGIKKTLLKAEGIL